MAKSGGANYIIIGKDGKVAIATSQGQLAVVDAAKLPAEVRDLIKKRQDMGKDLTDALAKCKFSVRAHSVTKIIDPLGEAPKAGKSKKRSR